MTSHIEPPSFLTLFLRRGSLWMPILLILGAMPGISSVRYAATAYSFATSGIPTVATVVSTSKHKERGRASRHREFSYRMTLSYTVDNEAYSTSRPIIRSEYETLKPGDEHLIHYLPEDPRRIEVERGSNWNTAKFMGIIALAILTAWFSIAWRAFRFADNAQYVRKNGMRTLTQVIEHQSQKLIGRRHRTTELIWQASDGTEGRSLPLPEEEATHYQLGYDIAIYELPGSGRPSCWEGDVGHA